MNPEHQQIRDQQKEAWDKTSPSWKKWDDITMAFIQPVGEAIVTRVAVQPTDRVLDVAGGTGQPGMMEAMLATEGEVVVADLSEGMLGVAREHAEAAGLANMSFQQADAGALPFEDGAFDVVTCRFGHMFFPDVARATAEMARVAKPGGRVCAAVWGMPEDNPWGAMIMGTIREHIEMPPPGPDAPGLFRLGQQGLLAKQFVDAGLEEVTEETLEGVNTFESGEQYWSMMTEVAAPIAAVLAAADDDTVQAIRREVIARAEGTTNDGSVVLPWKAIVVHGIKPGA